jgi:hypothetical protein
LFWDPGVRPQLLDLMANVFIYVLEGVKESRSHSRCSGAILYSVAQILFGGMCQPAIGVIDNHEFLGI